MNLRNLITAVCATLSCAAVNAAEADHFTNRDAAPEAAMFLNEKMNAALDEIASGSTSCEEDELHAAIIGKLGGFGASRIERWGREVPTYNRVPMSQSIYGTSTGVMNIQMLGACCAPTFKLGGNVVSADKLGHFLHSGYEMFYAATLRSERRVNATSTLNKLYSVLGARRTGVPVTSTGINAVFDLSHYQETNGWGLNGPGVYSYGDIAANYDGYRFWTQVSRGTNPYFKCDAGKWKRVRRFDWLDFATAAWDEGINCSTFRADRAAAISAQITRVLTEKGVRPPTCPVSRSACAALVATYPSSRSRILHPACLRTGQAYRATPGEFKSPPQGGTR
ncbi:MAG: hypothetical protein ABL958_04230 [Bdellovibrionia bacterium]